MGYLEGLLDELSARLPELEWQVCGLSTRIVAKQLPQGLFRQHFDATAVMYINEVKEDIHTLAKQKNQSSGLYLAERIKRKIDVLVMLCQIDNRKEKPESRPAFSLKSLSTRQQWLHSLEQEVATLSQQHQALSSSLLQLTTSNPAAVLNLKAELGKIEQRLTLAQEALARAIAH